MKKRLSFLFAVLVGAMFLVSGISKLLAIQPFEWQFIDLGLSGRWPSIAARTLVVLEIALGFFLITCQFLKNFTVPLTLLVLLVFSIYLGYDIAINGNNGKAGIACPECFLGGLEISPHIINLRTVSPAGARFYGHNVADTVMIKFQVDARDPRLPAVVHYPINKNGQPFQPIAEDGFFLRRNEGICQAFDNILRG